MFAPKALKSDKGQNIDRGGSAPDCSSSEFSEDDTPLAVRLNSQGRSQPNDTGKQRPRAALSKKGGFVIPRKKKQANELLQVSNFNAREGKDLLRHVTQSYRDTAVGATFKFEKLELVYNDQLSREFQDKKQHMRNDEGRNARELEDKFAFLYTVDRDEAKKICEVGLEVGSSSISCLGDPSMGVYLCRHADVISRRPLLLGVPGYLIVFKVIKGKVKPVTERSAAVTDLLEPSPNFNCHVSRSIQSLPANSPLSLVFEYSQYYFYEYAEEGDDLHVKRPRQCLPYALLTFTMVDSSAPPQEPSALQEEVPTTDNNGFLSPVSSTCILRHETRIPEKRRGRGSHVIWMGVVANKDRILAEAQLVCHSVQKIKPPFEIGEKIVMKEKISFEQLRPLLTFPLFHSGPPSVTNACQASLAGGTSFLHCDLLPVEDDHGKIQKLVKFFQQKKWAGIVKCPDANRVIFLIPTSQITFDLGITTVDSPAALHVLLYVKNQKSKKGNGISKTVTREKDLRDLNQIQKELKRQFSYQVEGKEKPTEHRRLSQDSARSAVASASSCKDPRDVPEFVLQSNEQAVQWKNAVENWLSRPHPLGGTEADLQKAVASSGSVLKMAHLSSSVTHVPKPRVPMAETPLNIPFEAVHARSSDSTEQYRVISGQQDASAESSAEEYKVIPGRQDGGAQFSHCVSTEKHKVISGRQDGHARLAGNAEQQRLFVGEHSDIISRQVKQHNVIKEDAKPSVPPVIRKEEHREDPRLKIRRSLDEQVNTGLKSPNILQISHGTPYNAEEALQAQGVKLESTSVTPVITSTTPSTPQLKYQVDDKSIRELLDKINVQNREESTYKVALDDGTRRALELMKKQGANKSKPEVPEAKKIVMDANTDSKLDTGVSTRDDKSVKRSSTSVTAEEENVKRIKINNVNQAHENMSTVKGAVPTASSKEGPVKHGESSTSVTAEEENVKRIKINNVNPAHENMSTVKGVVPTASSKEEPAKHGESSTSVTSAEENVKRIKINNGNQAHENMSTVKGVVPTASSKEEAAKHGEKAQGQPPRQRPEKKPQKVSHVKEPKEQNDSPSGEEPIKPVVETTVPELSEAPFPKILSPESLKSPQTSVLMSKAPKVKLILRKKDSKDVGSQSHGETGNSSEDALSKQPSATEDEQKGDLERGKKVIDSPVSMDISPQCTTPSLPESGSPITVVSSKGRYQMPVPPTATPTTTVHSAQSYATPVASSFPFTPPLPEGPYRSTILPQPKPPPPSPEPVHLMPFVPPLPTASSVNTTPSLAGALPSFKGPTVSSASSGGSVPCNPPFQDASSFVPHSAVPHSGSPYPPPPSAHQASVQSKNSIDAFSSPASSAGKFPTTFPGQQWTGALQHSQGFVFPVAPLPGVVAIPPTEVLRWPTGPGLPRPVLPPAPGRPLNVFPQQLACPPQTTPFQGSLGEIPVQQPQGGGFVPIGVPRFHLPPMPPARTAQITPVRPIFAAPPVPPQFQPRLPFQHPSPIGYWVAPLKPPAVHSGKTTGHVGRMPSHSPAQKHSKELQQTSPSSQKNTDPSVDKVQNENQEQNKEHSNDASSEGPESNVSVQNGDEKEKSNAQLEKHREVDVSKVEMNDVDTSKEDKVVTTTNIDKKATAGTDEEIVSEAVEESVVGSAKQLSRHTDEVKVQDSETLIPDQMLLEEPLKPSSKFELASAMSANKENQIAQGQPTESSRDDSTEQRSKSLQGSPVADSVSSEVCIEVEEHSQMAAGESKNSSSPVTSELAGNFGEVHTDVSVSGKIAGVLEIDYLPTITYQTEAERKGFKAKSKIYDILRQNAQQMRSETDSADQVKVEDLDDPDKPDDPDSCAMDEELIAGDEGIAEEEKLLLSGEESTAGEQAVQLDCGLRVVQLLELDRIHEQEKERACEEATTLVSSAEHEDGQPQEEIPCQLPSHKKQQEMLPMDSEFEDISDVSDEGTPERDLPGYGSVDIEQLWSSKAVDIAEPVSEAAPTDTVHSTVPVLEAAPVDTVDRTMPLSETAPVDTAHSTLPEAAPELLPKEVSKPKAEVGHNEADSSSSLTKKHGMRKRHITVQSQKRKRWDSTSEDTDANKYSSSSKRSKKNSHRRCSHRKSPDRHETGSSSRKRERARRTSESSGVKSEPPSRRIVSEFEGGSLQITILRGVKSEEMEVKEEEETISPEKQENEEKHPLLDVEYSDLEDISPGRLSSDDESPATPPTPETAIPAMDFTHPSLGFWAAPLKTNEPSVSGSAVVEEHQVSGKEIFAPPTHSSRLEEHPVNLEPSQVRYPLGDVKFYEDEPFIGQPSWPAEGFFCQTTTSEERDLVSQGMEKDPFLLDDSFDHYLSRSSQESEEDITRYAQEYPQSEVFEYGHGVRDHLQPQETLYRSSSHAQSRGMQKEVKHRSANREARYPWKTREESKHSQVPSAGGEEIASASQSATGKNIGCDEESSKHATTKRHKDIKGAHSTNGNESAGDDVRDWKIYVFASMKKPQFENWIRRKNFAAKLAGKCSVVLTPEHVRRSSERWYRRVKKQLRRTNHSSRPQTEGLETSDCLEFDFDDMDVENNCVKAPSANKEQSCSSVSKELQQCDSVNVNSKVERCTVHSTHMEHRVSPGTERSDVVHRHVTFNSIDECNFNTDDRMCDREVSIILKQDDMDDVSTSNVGNDNSNSSVLDSVTSKLAGKNIPVKAEQYSDGLLEDQVTLCEEDDMRTNLTSEAAVGCIKQQGEAKECPVAEMLDESACHHADGEGNEGKVIGGENEVVLGLGFGEVIDGQGGEQEQDVAADGKSMIEAEVIRTVDLSVNVQHNQGMEGTLIEVKKASLIHTKDIAAEDAKMDVTESYQVGVLTDTAEVADDHGSCQDPAKVARQDIQEVENTLVHTDGHDGEDTKYSVEDESVKEGNDVGSQVGTDYIEDKPPFTATAGPQTNIDGNFDKATVVLEQDERGSVESGDTNTTATYRSPIVSSLVTSSTQLGESQNGSSNAVVATPYQPNVLNLPALQGPSLNAVTTPIIPVTSCFPAFQNFQQNLAWQVARHASPFTTSAIVPVQAPTHPPGNYGLDSSLVHHPLHAPIPVGCVRSHSMYDDDICPPGTENISLQPSSDSADLAPRQETQEEEETSKSMVDKQLHGSVMDNSMVTALMQFYSEIEEVESSERNGVERADDTTETNSAHRVSKTVEESTQTKSSKSHETTKDMEVESGREHSYKGVPEDEEMSETEYVADSVHKTTESVDRGGILEGENRELESTGTSTKESQSTGGIVCSEVDITRVENCVDRIEVENPVMMNLETIKDEILVKNPKVETERAQVTDSGITEDTPQVEYSSITMNESLADSPGNSMDITLSVRLDTDETVAENGPLVENANAIIDKTKVNKANDLIETILTKEPDDPINETLVGSLGIAVDGTQTEDPCTAVDGTHEDERPSKSVLTKKTDVSLNETLVDILDIAVDGTQMEEPCIVLGGTQAEDPDHAIMGGLEEEHCGTHAEEPADAIMEGLEEEHRGTHAERPEDVIMEGLEEEHSLSPIDPLFMASAERTIFSSIGDLRNLLGQSSTFDRIAEEAIASTVSSLEDVLRQAHRSYLYLESNSCPSDSGVSVGEEVSAPSRSFSNVPVSTISLPGGDASKISSAPGWSAASCLSAGMPSQVVTATDARANDRNGTTSYVSKEKLPTQKKIKKTAGHRKFYFYVYSPEHDRECEAVKNYMLKAGGSFVDVKDPSCLEENSRELKVFIRRKHLPAVHRLANLYQLKMLPCVRFSLFNTLTDVIEGSRFYENIFVSGGALLTDDSILKTIELDHLDALLRYLKEQSLAHQKFVWVLNISRNGYKKLSLSRPQSKRDSKVLNLIRQYREEGFITVLQKGYVAESVPATQRYLQTSLKLQIDLISVYRHVILLSDMDKKRMELPWFLERGIGVMNVQEFLITFAGEKEASRLLSKRLIPEVTVKESSTVPYCSTPEDETVSQTPEGTPMSDSSNDSPYTDTHALELPHSSGLPQKRAVRSSSVDADPMTHTRLHILSCVRSVRDNIRSQISSSSPSSPVSRSM